MERRLKDLVIRVRSNFTAELIRDLNLVGDVMKT